MESKKISFGFSNLKKPTNLIPVKLSNETPQIELIKCLEGQEIKLVVEKEPEAPLVIPMKENTQTTAALASLIKRRAVLLDEDDGQNDEKIDIKKEELPATVGSAEETLDQRAVREILSQVGKESDDNIADANKLVVPILKPDELPLDGAKESTIDDYDSIPIQKFGMAMLRGMGFKEPEKKKNETPFDDMPSVRPKGMGLGADKALKSTPLLVQPEKNEILEIKKQAYVRILAGKHKNAYGQIEGFDNDVGRVIVKLAIGGIKEIFNEFLCQPVSRKEFTQYGKCINSVKYEEYKKMENEYGQIVIKEDNKAEHDFDWKNVKTKKEKDYHESQRDGYKRSAHLTDYKESVGSSRDRKIKIEKYEQDYKTERKDETVKYEQNYKTDRKIKSEKFEQDYKTDRKGQTGKYEQDYKNIRKGQTEKVYEQPLASSSSYKNYSRQDEHKDVNYSERNKPENDYNYSSKSRNHKNEDTREYFKYKNDSKNAQRYEKVDDKISTDCYAARKKIEHRSRSKERFQHRKRTHSTSDTSSSTSSDSSPKRHSRKKLSHKSKKKTKKSKHKKRHHSRSSTSTDSSSSSSDGKQRKRRKHKKKSKK